MENCPRFLNCSYNICPLDPKAHLRNRLPEEGMCAYTRDKKKWGKRERMPQRLRKLVPEKNRDLLSWRNRN